MIAPLIIYPIAKFGFGVVSPITLYPVVFGTTIIWLVVTFITEPTSQEILSSFYKKVHPGGIGWKRLAEMHPEVTPDAGYGGLFVSWIFGVVLVYSALFGIGELVFTNYLEGIGFLALTALSIVIIYLNMKKQGFEAIAE